MKKYKLFIPVLIASAMGTLDTSIVNVAMPTLTEVFAADMSRVSWISMAYLLVMSSFLLTSGRLGDMFGYKRPFNIGVFVFTFGTVLCGISPSINFLIGVRAFQALGGSLMIAIAPAVITAYMPPEERGKALGLNVFSVAVGLCVGPVLGGILLTHLGWRSIFFLNLPLGMIAYLTGKIFIPDEKQENEGKFDFGGTALIFIFLTTLLFYINMGNSIGWLSKSGYFLIITSLLSLVFFIIHERKTSDAMLDLGLFSNHKFTLGLFSCFIYFLVQFVMIFLTPFLLTAVGYSPEILGLVMMSFPLTMVFMGPFSGNLSDKVEPNFLSSLGSVFVLLSLFLISRIKVPFTFGDIALRMAIFGIGGGLFETSNAVTVIGGAPDSVRGVASGILATVRNTGMVFGIGISSALLNLRQGLYIKTWSESEAMIMGIKDVFFISCLLALLCIFCPLLKMGTRSSNTN